MTPKEVLAQIRQSEVTTVDLRFMDFPGVWQHFAIPAVALTEETFEEGIGFDGSSVVGWRAINEADLLVVKKASTLGGLIRGVRSSMTSRQCRQTRRTQRRQIGVRRSRISTKASRNGRNAVAHAGQ